MITSVITGDIVKSGKFTNPETWLTPLKECLIKTEIEKKYWEIFRGDSFQIEVINNQQAFYTAIYIKACIKAIKGLDVRMAIGVGSKKYSGDKVTESNGEAFVYSGETLENLKKEKANLKIKTPYLFLNEELNLYFKLASIAIDNWTTNSAEAVKLYLENQNKTQKELAEMIGINQDAVSKRLKRAYIDEIMELDLMFREKIYTLI